MALSCFCKSTIHPHTRWGEPMDKDLLRQNLQAGIRSLVEAFGRSWGMSASEPGPSENGVFFAARSVWAICTAAAVVTRHGREAEIERIGSIVAGEVAFLLQHGADPADPGRMSWYSADTAVFEPVKTTAAVVEALLAVWDCLQQATLVMPSVEPAEVREGIVRGIEWLCEKQVTADTMHAFTSHEGSTYHLVPLPGWQTIPEAVYDEFYTEDSCFVAAIKSKFSALMGDAVFDNLKKQPLWCGLRYDCRATKEALLALALCRSAPSLCLPKGLVRRIGEALTKAFFGLERAISADGWWSEIVCDNTFVVLSLLQSLPFQEEHYQDKIYALALRGLERTPRGRALESLDVCILNSYVWVAYLLGQDVDDAVSEMGTWISKYLSLTRNGAPEPYRPDYVSWFVVTQTRLYEEIDAPLQKYISTLTVSPAAGGAPPPHEWINRLASLASLLVSATATLVLVILSTVGGLAISRRANPAISLAITPPVALTVLTYIWRALRPAVLRWTRERIRYERSR
jgi:hypothetical protein